MSPRSYRLGKRAESAEETRKRVVDAARLLFEETGFHRVSIEAIAARAGVGRTTIFERFGSKRELLQAVEQEVSRRAGVEELLPALRAPDARAALRSAFQLGCQVWAREHGMFRKLFGLALVDPEMRQVVAEKELTRQALVDHLASALHSQGSLRPGTTVLQAVQVLGLLTSFESFSQLYARSGDAGVVADTLEQLVGVLLAPIA